MHDQWMHDQWMHDQWNFDGIQCTKCIQDSLLAVSEQMEYYIV